ncbi:hypothetical protein ASD65_08360 [Microbacterium sp. Root61]|uniref:nuclear transport factor 2 family protein n=1 Tax=Microbacterium sp. Root61 TaxID=1736570 RepID=UPI0006F84C0B|nr:DUF4440 domain-containing protein [Microbacterium sp. Root61]KRA24433.1 hypothetical protein ASD65_08360 [Microbacterium sp. Root61]
MTTDRVLRNRLVAAELRLLDPRVRTDRDAVAQLLAPDFVEIGQSGRIWTRAETLEALEAETGFGEVEMSEATARELSPGLYLLTYRLRVGVRQSRRSSLWRVTAGGPLLEFHQGTVAPA